jgi:signal transduction histidine kinase/CheY-like chemotaxis protein
VLSLGKRGCVMSVAREGTSENDARGIAAGACHIKTAWRKRPLSRWMRGLLPILAVVLLRWVLEPALEDKSAFLLFTVAVMASSIYGGVSVSVAATFIGALAGLYFMEMPRGAVASLVGPSRLLQLALYLAVCAGIVYLVEALRRTRERAEGIAQEQARLARELSDAHQAKDRFLATLSHELRTPLNAIIGWASLLRTGDLDEAGQRRALDTIERNTRLQKALISDLLDLSRIVAGKLRLQVEAVELLPILEGALDIVQPAALAKRISVELRANAAPHLRGDPQRLYQVFWNLLTNAIKFTPEGGRIAVDVAQDDSMARVRVEDSGPGIPPACLPHVFDRFQQASGAEGGLGLGLAIAKDLVLAHGGAVGVTNRGPGGGAIFDLSLPLGARAADVDEGAVGGESQSLKGLRVLLVDDEPDAREMMGELLKAFGAEVTSAASAAEAMVLVERVQPDVLLSDIGMPGEDGLALIRRVRALPPGQCSIPAAAVTAYTTDRDRRRAEEAGFQRHITKPIEPAALAAAVAELALKE